MSRIEGDYQQAVEHADELADGLLGENAELLAYFNMWHHLNFPLS